VKQGKSRIVDAALNDRRALPKFRTASHSSNAVRPASGFFV